MKVAEKWMASIVVTFSMCAGAVQPDQSCTVSADGVQKNIQYADRDGCELDLYIPQGVSNFPVVVWFHGGGLTGGEVVSAF